MQPVILLIYPFIINFSILKFLPVIISCLFCCRLFSQAGCTDPLAQNYNASAILNDGSCTYNPTLLACHLKGSLTASVTESSGLLYMNGIVWTHNDSGHPAELFKIDTANGAVLQKLTIVNHTNTDWEDITADNDYIYVGDFGNNDGMRTDLKVLRIRKDSIGSAANATVNATAINFSYSDQTSFTSNSSNNFDCESIISIGNFLYLFSKDRGDFETRVYKLSKTPGTYVLTPYTSYNVSGEITGADYNPQTHEIVLIGYLSTKKNSFLWFLNDFTGEQFFSGNKRRIEIGNSTARWQTEGVAYASNNELFISCETADYPAGLYTAYKPFDTPVGIKNYAPDNKDVNIYPNPAADYITLESNAGVISIEILSADGAVCYKERIREHAITIPVNKFACSNGLYILKVNSENGSYVQKLVVAGQ